MKRLCKPFTILFLILSAIMPITGATPLQTATPGTVVRHVVRSPQLGEDVDVDVWLPAGYSRHAAPYPVIYMHDGQNLFDASTTWNHQTWNVDSVAGRLAASGEIEAPVIVGIHSNPETRIGDLMPQRALEAFPASMKGMEEMVLRGDRYGDFIVNTLKPLVDTVYNVRTDAASTSVMGSSMGGIVSVYLMCEYPDIFGAAAGLSTHWIGFTDGEPEPDFVNAVYRYLESNLPADGAHRLYLDRGTETVDANYGPADDRMTGLAESKGYRRPVSLETYVDKGASHEENAWMRRVGRPLRFLLGGH